MLRIWRRRSGAAVREGVETEKTSYHLLRLLAMFFVVATHMKLVFWTPEQAGDPLSAAVSAALGTWLLSCNGLFFMLSGRFILEQYVKKAEAPLLFYRDRFFKIAVPAFLAAAFQFFYLYRSLRGEVLLEFVRQLLGGKIIGYLWFLFPLFGFYLAVPFLGKLFHVLCTAELRLLFWLGFLYFALENAYQLWRIDQLPNGWPFYGWLFYCVLGYLIDRLDMAEESKGGSRSARRKDTGKTAGEEGMRTAEGAGKHKRRLFACLAETFGAAWLLIPAGVIAALLSGIEAVKFPGVNPALDDFAPSMLLLTAAVYVFVTRAGAWFFARGGRIRDWLAKGIARAGRASFFLYLLHGFVQNILMLFVPEAMRNGALRWIGMSILCFLLSLLGGLFAERFLYQPYLSALRRAGLLRAKT